MSKEQFKKLISELGFRDGAIYHGSQRLWLSSVDWIANLQKRMEDTPGPNGSYAIIYDASSEGGKQLGKALAAKFGGMPLEDQIRTYFGFATLRGIGRLTVEEFQQEPFFLWVEYENSHVTGVFSGTDGGRCYMTSGFSTIIEGFLEAHGINRTLTQEESECVAMGDDHCEIIIKDV